MLQKDRKMQQKLFTFQKYQVWLAKSIGKNQTVIFRRFITLIGLYYWDMSVKNSEKWGKDDWVKPCHIRPNTEFMASAICLTSHKLNYCSAASVGHHGGPTYSKIPRATNSQLSLISELSRSVDPLDTPAV